MVVNDWGSGTSPVSLNFTAYVDGVEKFATGPESRLPEDTNYHYNVLQEPDDVFEPHGDNVAGANVNDNVEDGGDGGLNLQNIVHGHDSTDDGNNTVGIAEHPDIQDNVLGSLKAHISR